MYDQSLLVQAIIRHKFMFSVLRQVFHRGLLLHYSSSPSYFQTLRKHFRNCMLLLLKLKNAQSSMIYMVDRLSYTYLRWFIHRTPIGGAGHGWASWSGGYGILLGTFTNSIQRIWSILDLNLKKLKHCTCSYKGKPNYTYDRNKNWIFLISII